MNRIELCFEMERVENAAQSAFLAMHEARARFDELEPSNDTDARVWYAERQRQRLLFREYHAYLRRYAPYLLTMA